MSYRIRELKRRHLDPKLNRIAQQHDSLHNWTLNNIRLRGKPFSFVGHSYLKELYADPAPRLVIRKAAQMGGSTYALARSLHTALHRGARGIYYMPTDGEAKLFSQDRLQSWAQDSLPLHRLIDSRYGIHRLGNGMLMFRGLVAEMRVRSVDADFIVLDELDCLSPIRRNQALDRLLHSELRHVIELSTPKMPGTGIDARFSQSDMRHWLIKCAACGREEPLEDDFPACIAEKGGEAHLVCVRCDGILDAQQGRWVSAKPDIQDVRGYHFCGLYSCMADLKRLLDEWQSICLPYERERFYNSVLGLPYSAGCVAVGFPQVEACMADEEAEMSGALWAGIDVGDEMHVVLARGDAQFMRITCCLRTSDWDELKRIIAASGARVVVIDAMPYKASAKRLARELPSGMVNLAYYGGNGRRMGREDGIAVLRVERTEMLDELSAHFCDGTISLPSRSEEGWRAARHVMGLHRIQEVDREGRMRMVYPRGGEDHYAHAMVYVLMARWIRPFADAFISPRVLGRKKLLE